MPGQSSSACQERSIPGPRVTQLPWRLNVTTNSDVSVVGTLRVSFATDRPGSVMVFVDDIYEHAAVPRSRSLAWQPFPTAKHIIQFRQASVVQF